MSSFGTRFAAGLVLVPLVTLAAPARTTAATVTDCGDTGGPGQLRASVAAGGELVVDKDLTIQGAGALARSWTAGASPACSGRRRGASSCSVSRSGTGSPSTAAGPS